MLRQQVWAKSALEQVTKRKNGAMESKFSTLCMKTPNLIHASGLAQGLTFLLARDQQTGKDYLQALATVLRAADPNRPADGIALQKLAVETLDLSAYMALTRDVMAAAVWLRRFAKTELKLNADA